MVQQQVEALVKTRDWQTLSGTIQKWDQNRAVCCANISLAETAIRTVLEDQATEIYEGHTCHPDPIMYFSDETVEIFEILAVKYPDSYPLLAIAAQMRCAQGWTHRGADYSAYVSDDGWFGMAERFEMAAELLDGLDPVTLDAPLLAATRHKLLAFMPDAHRHVKKFYEEWSALTPLSTTPHQQHAMMMLPRWFGSDHDLQIAASQAVANTQTVTGETAYFAMYRTALDDWDPNVLSMDTRRFAQGARDFLTLRGNDPAIAGYLIDNMVWWSAFGSARGLNSKQKKLRNKISKHLKVLRRELIRERLTAIFPKAWDGGKDACMVEILGACSKELDEGFDIVLGPDGISFELPHLDAVQAKASPQ